MKLIFFVTIVFLFLSCTEEKNITSKYNEYIIDSVLLSTDSALLRNTSKIFIDNDTMYFSVFNKNKNQFEIFNLNNFKKQFSKDILYTDIIDYDIHNFDTLYLLRKNNIITLSDTSFEAKHNYIISSKSKYYYDNYHLFAAFSSPFVVKNDTAYIIHLTTLPVKSKKEFQNSQNNENEVHILLKDTANIIEYAGNFPQDYQNKLLNDKIPFRTFKDNVEIFSFCYSDSVKLSNNQSFALKSNYFKINSEFNFEARGDLYEIMRFHVENPAYNLFLYDKYRYQFYRICKHSIDYENDDGTLNFPDDATWSLLVVDTNFNIKNEILFPPFYSRHDIFITPVGILIKKYNSIKYDNKKIEFDIFRF